MAVDKKISQLASGAPAQAGDEYVVARSGANYKLTLTNIAGNMPATTISSGNLTFSSTGQRITGDMSNATHSSRLLFQNSGANLPTVVGALPNGSSVTSAFVAYGGSTATDTATVSVVLNGGTDARINSGILGTGTYLPMTFYTGGSERMRLDTSGKLGLGLSSVNSGFIAQFNGSIGLGSPTRNQTTSALIGIRTSNDPADDSRSTITFGTTAGASSSDSYIAFSTNKYGVSGGERVRIDPNGNVGIGTASPGSRLDVVGSAAGAVQQFLKNSNGSTSSSAEMVFGTWSGSTPSAPQAKIAAINMASSDARSDLAFSTYTGAALTERMRIDSSGNVGIGGTAGAASKLNVLGTYSAAGNNAFAVTANGSIPSGATTNGISFLSVPTTAAASFTCSQLSHFYASQGAFGAGSAVTNQFGFYVESTLTGATNNFGFYSNIASGSNRWNFYAAGTARNYFAGGTGIGVLPTGYTNYSLSVQNTGASAALFISDTAAQQTTFIWNQATSGDNVFAQFGTDGGAAVRGSIDYNRAGGAVRYNTTSDYRAKDVFGAWDDAGATIDALKVYRGKMHGATLERPMMIAHEAQAVVPYAVSGDKDAVDKDGKPVYQQMDHQVLVPLLIAELQAVRARLAALEAK